MRLARRAFAAISILASSALAAVPALADDSGNFRPGLTADPAGAPVAAPTAPIINSGRFDAQQGDAGPHTPNQLVIGSQGLGKGPFNSGPPKPSLLQSLMPMMMMFMWMPMMFFMFSNMLGRIGRSFHLTPTPAQVPTGSNVARSAPGKKSVFAFWKKNNKKDENKDQGVGVTRD